VLLLHNLPFPWKVKKINSAASYIFYAAGTAIHSLALALHRSGLFRRQSLYTQTNIHKNDSYW